MSDLISPLLQWLNAHPELAGLVTFLISAGESVAILGTIVPGSIMMTALGALAGAGVIPLWPTIFWAIMGAIVGDGISYWLGHYFKDRLPNTWPFYKYPGFLKSGEVFFHKYGSMSVFIGRFVGPVRALVPLVAGMLGMKPLQFTVANVASAIGWAPAYMLPGILLGAASLELPPDIAIHVILVFILLILFILLCLWFAYKLFQLIREQTNQLEDNIWQKLKSSRHLSSLTVILRHHDPAKTHGQLTLGLGFLLTSFLFICLIFYVMLVGPQNMMMNDVLYHLARGIRQPGLDVVMINITLLGQKQVILPAVMALFAILLIRKRWRVAFYAISVAILAGGSVYIIKNILKSPRPWGIFASPETYSLPSGHATLSMTVYMGLAFIVASNLKNKSYNVLIYGLALALTFMVGISRVYLGAHWFTDIVAGWLLSAAILMFIIIAYQRKAEKPLYAFGILLVSLLTLVLSYSVYHHYHFTQLQKSYELIDWPKASIAQKVWWQNDGGLPAYQVSLFGIPSTYINIEWAGDLNQIKDTLLEEGWSNPPARNWISTLHRITDISSSQYLPLISPQYLNHQPQLILTRQINPKKGFLVLRLWDSNRRIKETNTPIWVGNVGVIPRSYSWLYKKARHFKPLRPSLIFMKSHQLAKEQYHWQWKLVPIQMTDNSMAETQPILLVLPTQSSIKK